MKQAIALLMVLAVVLFGNAALAQDEASTPSIPRWISDKGYWVAETNVHTPTQYTIRFYNNDHVMVYSEKVEGIKLKLQKRKVKMNLKKVLETSLQAWEAKRKASENEGWVLNTLH
jgi:hypothetical protein